VTGGSTQEAAEWIFEIVEDEELRSFVSRAIASSPRRGLADREVRVGRRAGWYAVIRALKPAHVVETGTDKGLGSVVIAAALLRNGCGHLTTIDINPASGYLIGGSYAEVTTRLLGDSITAISGLEPGVGVFIHDSDHSAEHELHELRAIEPLLLPEARVLSDNAHATDSLMEWALQTRRQFLYFQEVPDRHWYPGAGIGAAWMDRGH